MANLCTGRPWLAGAFLSIASAIASASGDIPDVPRDFEPPRCAHCIDSSGAIVIVGYNDMRSMLEPLAALFTKQHPGARIALDLPGTRFAPSALAEGRSALAPMGAEFTPSQLADYRAHDPNDPVAIRVAHASLDPEALSGPLAVFVHRDNPLRSLTVQQLGAIYSGRARRWGDVGAANEWSTHPIHAVGVETGTPLALAFQKVVPDTEPLTPRMTAFHQSADVVARVSTDPFAIGYAAAMRELPDTRTIALAADARSEAVPPTQAGIETGRYPLDRHLLIYVRSPIDGFSRAFVSTVLSDEGQAIVAATPQRYRPLSSDEIRVERAKLGPSR